MRKYIVILCSLCALSVVAQTNVIKTTALKSNQYGIVYHLPKTQFVVQAWVTKTTQKAGVYNQYAQKYLGINQPILEDKVYYTLDKVELKTLGVANKDQSYLIEFKAKTTAPFVYLTEDGLLCTINAEYEPELAVASSKTEEESKKVVQAETVYSEEYIQAGSVPKMAEVAAKQIYRLRESKMDLLTGEAENVPRDGEAMKLVLDELTAREQVLMQKFCGTVHTEEQQFETSLTPEGDTKLVLFRFSTHLGIVEANDYSGAPVYITIKSLEEKKTLSDPKEQEKKEKAKINPKGVIYNIPGKSRVEIVYGTETIYSGEHLVAQFGDTEVLLPAVLEDKKAPLKIYFYPETGALKQIIQ